MSSLSSSKGKENIFEKLPKKAVHKIFDYLDFKTKLQLEGVSKSWRGHTMESYTKNTKEVWIYTIFRKGQMNEHETARVKFSYHGPIFWSRQVVYMYFCVCHFHQNESVFRALCQKLGKRVDRICLVDSPVNYPYLTDTFYHFILDTLPVLKWIYLREIDLEPISWSTVQRLSKHPTLKKIIAHWCRNYDALENFGTLPQLLICNQAIRGLKYLEDLDKQIKEMNIAEKA